MLIIVEGPDGSGKTTLVRKIREANLVPTLSCIGFGGCIRQSYDCYNYIQWVDSCPIPVLLSDRFPIISEAVYGPLLRNSFFEITPPNGIHHYGRLIASMLSSMSRKVIIIYTQPPPSVLLKRVTQNQQMEGVISNIRVLQERYDSLISEIHAESVVRFNQRLILYAVDTSRDLDSITLLSDLKVHLSGHKNEANSHDSP